MTFEELKDKALSLPFAPGVYIMRDAGNKVIYVGKAKKLKKSGEPVFPGFCGPYAKNPGHGVKDRPL